ncbi:MULTISPECIES: helix-turn-helix domain-containing protein [unclassified Frondihabitans]|uniref:AraC family transcriptional regulator n=1 Tax=unclassified Frondihabitans TaxID=2626248 RepID=UPI000F4DD4BC|nr:MULTISPECIES: helix-turn-helix domain-containing protein [unclassified Frondihabitans]RPE78102.1 AraC-like DNA-binding protein [Frondihabitans sp. PhB153]RPF08383.1 AraC-like DNA-binding protein [Frondihabitans sp. PhB161]
MTETTGRIHHDSSGTNIDDARDVLAVAYHGIEWHAEESDSEFSYRYAATGDDTMTVRAVRFQGHLEGEMPAGNDFVVTWTNRGQGLLDVGKTQITMEPGRPQMWPNAPFRFSFTDYDQRLIQVNHDAVTAVLAERGLDGATLRFDHTVMPAATTIQQWRNTVSLISHTVLDRTASPILQAEMGRMAAVALIELYPLTTNELPPELLLPTNARVRLAVEYIHEHAHLPITTTDLAQIANISLRTLQQAFLRLFEVTPNTYLRQVRLDRIHTELARSDPSTTTVAAVARKWGIGHAGRFAAHYAERFGHYPAHTLAHSTPNW